MEKGSSSQVKGEGKNYHEEKCIGLRCNKGRQGMSKHPHNFVPEYFFIKVSFLGTAERCNLKWQGRIKPPKKKTSKVNNTIFLDKKGQ